MGKHGLIVFDGDDTLWSSEVLYDRARDAAGGVAAAAGLDPIEWSRLQRRIDVANFAEMGLSAERFPTSSAQAYEALAPEPDPAVAARVAAAARSVFDAVAEPVAGAETVVRRLAARYGTVLLTKGDEAVQRKRIADSGLGDVFDEVVIVDRKSPATFTRITRSHRVDPARSVSVGNSLASDVHPAVEAGLWAVWIEAHVWDHERRETEPKEPHIVVLDTIEELPDVVERILGGDRLAAG